MKKMKKLLKKMKNEKVAKGHIIGLAGPCFSMAGATFSGNICYKCITAD